MAMAFGQAGANVVLTGRDGKALDDAVRATEKGGGRAIGVRMEVTDRPSIDRAVEQAVAAFGTVDVLVNNAGMVKIQPFLEVTEADFTRLIDVNLLGVFRCCQAVGRLMVEKKRGKIINISSIGGIIGRTYGEVAYAATKSGVVGLTRCLAVEWARYNISVNAVCPGVFRTEINDHTFQDADLLRQVERRIAFRRLGTPEELAPLVVFLASGGSDFMTGEAIVVDGGETVR
jgi:2-deoxy-D-gluconate 3-dehydrogenase